MEHWTLQSVSAPAAELGGVWDDNILHFTSILHRKSVQPLLDRPLQPPQKERQLFTN